MAERPDPNSLDGTIPFVDRSIINDLFSEMSDEPQVVEHERGLISRQNPNLRDMLYAIAARKAPEDLAERQRIIDTGLLVVNAIDRAITAKKLDVLLASASFNEYGVPEGYVFEANSTDEPLIYPAPDDLPPSTQVA